MKYKIIALSLVLLGVVTMMLVSCSNEKSAVSDVYDVIPDNSSLIISTSDIDSVSSLVSKDNALVAMLYSQKSELGMPICRVVDSLRDIDMFVGHLMQDAVVAVRKDGNSGLCQLYVCKTDAVDENSLAGLVDTLKHNGLESRIFNEIEILKCRLANSNSSVFVSFANGLALFSSSSRYMEDALQCLSGNGKCLKDDACFAKAFSASGKNELANVFVNTRRFSDIFSSELFDDNALVRNFRSIDGWLTLDMLSGSPVSFNGFQYAESDSSSFVSFVKSQPAIEFNAFSVIPERSSAYMLVSFADAQGYDNALSEYMESTGKLAERNRKVADMNKAFGFDAKAKFYSIVKREFAYIVCDNDANQERGVYVACGLHSQSAAELELRNMVPDENIRSLGDGAVTVFSLPYDDTPAALFGDMFANCRGNYVFFIGNFMVFANSMDDIKALVRDVSLNNTMKASISHREFLGKFSTTSTMFLYYNFPCGTEMLKRVLSRQYSSDIDAKRSAIGNNGVCGVQFKCMDGLVFCNLSFGELDSKHIAESEIIWETNIGVAVAMKPCFVKNHDTGENEILVQDKNNMLYLLDASGKEIWHVLIDAPIRSQIYQVDAYKNGKLQYLFSTADKIYLVDRLGNFVDRYPLVLRAETTVPVSVFDYDGNHNYRIFAACNDNKVYVYDISGNLLKGWDFAGTENLVNSEISHYSISSEDFIVFHDSYKVYFVARNGSEKLKFLTGFKFSDNAIYCDVSGTPKFVTTDENGMVRRFFKDNRQDSISLGEFSSRHHFAMKDIDMDGKADYIFVDSARLSVYGNNGKLLFDYGFDTDVSAPTFYRFGGQTRIGLVSADGQLYLFNTNGTLHEDFPLSGEVPFSICESEGGNYSLVTGTGKGRIVNYRITK
ncbi:MAG: hypothetical protein IJK62_08305 [Bacteroidales bacterium]|nr:hypothetical protein [Bacteroidales bacterium]